MSRWMHRSCCAVFLLLPIMGTAQTTKVSHSTAGNDGMRTLVWSDEFNGPNGSRPNPAKWIEVTNGAGYGNNELEYYTPHTANVQIKNGSLQITARREKYAGRDGASRLYTSGRIETRGLFDLEYGRVEARIKLPHGQGLWPAFWMLGDNYDRAGWPQCGEIDIMENVGYEPTKVHGSLHGPGYSGGHPLTGIYTLPGGASFSDHFHVFAVEWEPRAIRFYVDGTLYETQTPKDLPTGSPWVFDHPFYIILNLAVGGFWPGNPDATTKLPQTMQVDYVRVYRLTRGSDAQAGTQ